MDNNITIFNESRFGEIRTTGSWMSPMFCLTDVCRILDLENSSRVKTRLDQKGVTTMRTPTSGDPQMMIYINEPNLYKCIFSSRKEQAIEFQNWICYDVLPTIRATGTYNIHQANDKLKEENEKLKEENALLLSTDGQISHKAITMQTFANLLSTYTGTSIGRTKLFALLRNWNYIMDGSTLPYQKYIDRGLFEVRLTDSDELCALVTQRGQKIIARRYRRSLPAPKNARLF